MSNKLSMRTVLITPSIRESKKDSLHILEEQQPHYQINDSSIDGIQSKGTSVGRSSLSCIYRLAHGQDFLSFFLGSCIACAFYPMSLCPCVLASLHPFFLACPLYQANNTRGRDRGSPG